MAKPKLKWARNFMVNARTMPEVFDELKRVGNEIDNAAGPGHRVSAMVTRGRGRARVQVTAETYEARTANAKNHVLLKALGRHLG